MLVSTDAGNVRPKVSPITAVGTIGYIEEERERDIGDWRVLVSLAISLLLNSPGASSPRPRKMPR